MIDLVKFQQTVKLNSKECLPNLNGHYTVPIEQRVIPAAEVTTRQKASSSHDNISSL